MAERIDANGYFLTPDGREDIAKSSDHAHWQKVIQNKWAEGHTDKKGNVAPMPSDYAIMFVQKGDCQWDIATDASANPGETAYTINKQFPNPDLIHPGDIVFLPPSTHYNTTNPAKYGQQGEEHDNADIFADQTFDHAAKVGAYDSADLQPGHKGYDDLAKLKSDIHTYVTDVMNLSDDPDPNNDGYRPQTGALQNLLAKPSWGDKTEEGTYGRHLVLTDYLSRFDMKGKSAEEKSNLCRTLR